MQLPEPPPITAEIFGDALPIISRYADLLATDGVVRGLIGPREVPRLWERHLINCALVGELIDPGATVVDVGSGAGLPGIVLALSRPDLTITLVEPLARRTVFLDECVAGLTLPNVTVLRGRAEEPAVVAAAGEADVVTARAVAPLDKLAGWCLPLARVGGILLALKGASAADEITRTRRAVQKLGGADTTLHQCGLDRPGITEPTTVVRVVRATRGKERR